MGKCLADMNGLLSVISNKFSKLTFKEKCWNKERELLFQSSDYLLTLATPFPFRVPVEWSSCVDLSNVLEDGEKRFIGFKRSTQL